MRAGIIIYHGTDDEGEVGGGDLHEGKGFREAARSFQFSAK